MGKGGNDLWGRVEVGGEVEVEWWRWNKRDRNAHVSKHVRDGTLHVLDKHCFCTYYCTRYSYVYYRGAAVCIRTILIRYW